MSRKPSSGKKANLSQFGLLDIPDFDDGDEPLDMSDDDIDLEAELAAISGGGRARRPKKPAPLPASNLDAMIAESLKDIPSDDEGSGDDDDPDLLSELKELAIDDDEAPPPPPRTSRPAPPPPSSTDSSVISVLQDRITNYSAAEKHAKDSGESSRARRFGRGLKTLNDLLKQAKASRPVKNEDIPPPVSLGKPASEQPAAAPEPVPSAPPLSPPAPEVVEEPPIAPEPTEPPPPPPRVESQGISPERQEGLQIILRRKEEFKAAALSCKQSGDKALALEHLKVVKQFEMVVEAYKAGQEMDLSELPTPEAITAAFKSQQRGEESVQNSTEPSPPEPAPEPAGLITASSMAEALKQRLAAFQEQEAKAKEQGNSSKARRMGRIVKQYQDAIRLHAAGRPVPVDDLPTPSGYAPLPNEGSGPASPAKPTISPAAPRPPPRATPGPAPGPTSPAPASPSPSAVPAHSRHDRQLVLLLHKQKQFKDAALNAKREGNITQAKEYLRAAKGFDSLIEAARGGLIVDLNTLPLAPKEKKQIEQTFDIVSKEDCDELADQTADMEGLEDGDVLSRLQRQLTSQLQLCLRHKEHCRALGHVAEMNRFEHLATTVKQDLDVVVVAKSLGQDPPKFHYENKVFSVVQCNTDLNENDLELTIVRGIAYNVPNPKEIDTYVKFEFPYPQETPVSDRTATVKDTNSPQYDAVFTLPIQRNNRQCLRVFKRHAVKFELYSRGGWFSRDTLLATAAVKLAPLETQVTLNEAYPLMDGRRPAGGSLEVKLRVRTPLLQQQLEKSNHRWLVIDS